MKKVLKIITPIIILAALAVGYYLYDAIYTPNVAIDLSKSDITITNGSSFEDVAKMLIDGKYIEDESSFRLVSKLMKFDQKSNISGKYKIKPGSTNKELITLLRSGNQEPVNVTINSVRFVSDMAGKVSKYIEPDSMTLFNYLIDANNLQKWGYNKENLMSLFIPNTYEFYWDTSPEKFVNRMQSEHKKYWSAKGREQAISELGITKEEAYALASIIEKETTNPKERKTISGVYHNRLRNDIALQADPTVVYAVGDFTIRRVLNKHLKKESPYNTYIHTGLPPGPIYMPTLASLDAAIFPEDHKYIYFCAKPGYENEHSFASSLRAHNRNAKIFHNWLNQEGIKK